MCAFYGLWREQDDPTLALNEAAKARISRIVVSFAHSVREQDLDAFRVHYCAVVDRGDIASTIEEINAELSGMSEPGGKVPSAKQDELGAEIRGYQALLESHSDEIRRALLKNSADLSELKDLLVELLRRDRQHPSDPPSRVTKGDVIPLKTENVKTGEDQDRGASRSGDASVEQQINQLLEKVEIDDTLAREDERSVITRVRTHESARTKNHSCRISFSQTHFYKVEPSAGGSGTVSEYEVTIDFGKLRDVTTGRMGAHSYWLVVVHGTGVAARRNLDEAAEVVSDEYAIEVGDKATAERLKLLIRREREACTPLK